MALKPKTKRLLLCLLATLLLLVAVAMFILLLIFDRLYLNLVAKNLAISHHSPTFKSWLKPTVPILFQVYLFNLTNKDAVLAGGRPHLQQVGPFVYRETRERYDVRFGSKWGNNTVRYKHRIFYHFDPHLSVDDPKNLRITTPDLYYLGLLSTNAGTFAANRGPFVDLTADEVMWGYYPGVLKFFSLFNVGPKVGLFAKHNGTSINEFVVNTGASNIQEIGQIYEVDGYERLSLWDHPEANMINGTDGSLAPPGLVVGSTMTFFVPDICRSSTVYAINRTRTVNHKDIEVIVFTGTPSNLTDPLFRWRSRMFCTRGEGCPPKGLLSMKRCIASKATPLPLFLSQPFFLNADPQIHEAFDGLTMPEYTKHSTWVHIEPTTGFVLEAYKRVQFNIFLNNTDAAFEKMAGPYYFPIGWLTESAVADRNTLAMLHDKVLAPRRKLPVLIAIVSAIVFMMALILYVILFVCTCIRRPSGSGKHCGTVTPVSLMTYSKSLKDETLDSKLTQWSTKPMDDTPQVTEARPLLHTSHSAVESDHIVAVS